VSETFYFNPEIGKVSWNVRITQVNFMKTITVLFFKTFEIINKVRMHTVKFLIPTILLQTVSIVLEIVIELIFIVKVSHCSFPVANMPSEYKM
jgi:hypothetical protein